MSKRKEKVVGCLLGKASQLDIREDISRILDQGQNRLPQSEARIFYSLSTVGLAGRCAYRGKSTNLLGKFTRGDPLSACAVVKHIEISL